jgi:hypothetical protein
MMNTAAFTMQNGTPCLIYDGVIPHVREVEFCHDDHLLTLVWTDPGTGQEGRTRMDYPLSEHIVVNLIKLGIAAIGRMSAERRVEDLHITPVVFRAA